VPPAQVEAMLLLRLTFRACSQFLERVERSAMSWSDYTFDSTKFNKAFGFRPTSYVEGIRMCAQGYRQ
jgi:hypothetical protein